MLSFWPHTVASGAGPLLFASAPRGRLSKYHSDSILFQVRRARRKAFLQFRAFVEKQLNFCIFQPRKNTLSLKTWLERSDDIDNELKQTGIEVAYDVRSGAYKLSLQQDDITKHRDVLKRLMAAAYQYRMS